MDDQSPESDAQPVPVLIVGGGLVGLSMSLFLAWHGVSSVLVEKHPAPARLPRARGHNARTMELFRVLGLEETIRVAQAPTADNRGIVRVASLVGRELARLDDGGQTDLSAFSPTSGCIINQDQLEPILAAHAQKMGSVIRFGTEMVSFEQTETALSAIIRDRTTGSERRVRAQYLIAADGSHSGIRDALGIRTHGPGTISHSIDVAFEADLSAALRGRRFYLYYVSNPRLPDGLGGLMPLDNERRWSFGTAIHPERGERREDLTDERCSDLIRIAVGLPDLAVRILPAYPWDPIKVGVWALEARHAERYRVGRVFLAGDAAHAVLPSGGLGAGTGIQDAFNLAWKLALVLGGTARASLLDSYEEERLPIGRLAVEQTLQRHAYRAGAAERTFIDDAALMFGYRYHGGAIVPEPGTDDAPLTQPPESLCGEPGTRAPHLVLERDGARIATVDLCGGRWTLLTGAQGTAWAEAARHATRRLDLALSVQLIGATPGWVDVAGRWNAAYGVGATGAVLVRPDGFVAWRSSGRVTNPQALLGQALARVLGKT